jgi:hypothetical protein
LFLVDSFAMPLKLTCLSAVFVVGGAAVSIIVAPLASAKGADAAINNLQSQGYSVQINWVHGYDTSPLSDCSVTGVNYPDGSGASKTAYVDVSC